MLPRTTPWAVAFAFVLIVATAGAATQKAPLFATVGAGLDLAGSEATVEAAVEASIEVSTPAPPALLPRNDARGAAASPSNQTGPQENGTGGSGGNQTGGNNTNTTPPPPPPRPAQRAPELTPEDQNITGRSGTTMRFDLTLRNPDHGTQTVDLRAFTPMGWTVDLRPSNVTLLPGEWTVIEGRVVTHDPVGGRVILRVEARGADASDNATIRACARGILLDLCEPLPILGGRNESGNTTEPPVNGTNGTAPPSNHTAPPSNRTSPPEDQTTPPANHTSPPSNGTQPAGSQPAPAPAPAPTPAPRPSQPPSNGTAPEEHETHEESGMWVEAEVGAEGEASSDGLRVEV